MGAKQGLLDVAEIVDAWRVFPRLGVFIFLWLALDTHQWYVHLDDPTTGQGLYVTALWGAAAVVFKFYVDTGYHWNDRGQPREGGDSG